MESRSELTNLDYVLLVRLYNTIEVKDLQSTDQLYKDFLSLFYPYYIEPSAVALRARLTKGMCYYSSEFDLYIGGKPHLNSMYQIEGDEKRVNP